ncbi:MAG TPA: hypothetical protein VF173_26180 [Thermoanaerobaculia bacterium]|nr:hypothetical protein [Thermoanaerobaculia bacterium]
MSLRTKLSRLVVIVGLCCFAFADWSAVAEEVLRNQDVVKMVSAGLSEEIVTAKVREAPRVEFQLSVDDLIALRKAGVGDRVVQAMLARSKPAPQTPTNSVALEVAGLDSRLIVSGLTSVSLKSAEGTLPLRLIRGEVASPKFFVYMNYRGSQSPVRIRDKRPVLLVTSASAPEVGRYFFAKLNSDKREGVRSLKLGTMVTKTGRPGGRAAPDPDWVLPFDVKEESPGTWRIMVKRDLEPGEYGWYVNLEMDASKGVNPQGGGLFDFGID